MKQLKLEFNPYTYTRVQVMRTLLFKKSDYDRLLKLGFSEIADYLRKSTYSSEIEKLGLQYKGANLIENALNMNLKNTFVKIKRISDDSLRKALDAYLLREDFHTLKILLRAKMSGIELSDKQIDELTLEIGVLKKYQIELLRKAKTPYDMLRLSGIINMTRFKDLKNSSQHISLLDIEHRLDKEYYGKVLAFTEMFPKQGMLFAEFLMNEIDILNILTISKLISVGKSGAEVANKVIFASKTLSMRTLKMMANSKTNQELANSLHSTPYHAMMMSFAKGNEDPLYFKSRLYSSLLKRTIKLLHKHPLTVSTIIGYALMKDIEVHNLKTLIKGKQLGIKEEDIEGALVI